MEVLFLFSGKWFCYFQKNTISEYMLAVYMEKGYTMSVLEIKNLHVSVEDKEILKGLNLTLKTGEIAAIMGPNGTGKSTLSAAIMGNPNYEITEGDILFDGESILDLEVDERARLGLFLAMQYPAEIQGLQMLSLSVRL